MKAGGIGFWGQRLLWIAVALGGCFLADAMFQGFNNAYIYRLAVLAGLYVTLSVSLNLINGITGQFSIGHAAFYQVGAYAAGFATVSLYKGQPLDMSVWLPIMAILGGAAAALSGLIVGLPSLRLKGDYLAIVTLGFGEIIRIVVNNTPAIGGSIGMKVLPKTPNVLWLVLLLAVICIAVCRNLLKNVHGLSFLSVREDEVASSAMGVDVTRIKVTAFMIGSAFAGIAGALFAHYEGYMSPDYFKMDVSFLILTMVVLGGTGSITGSVVAALLLFAIPEAGRLLKINNSPIMINAAVLSGIVIALVGAVVVIKWVIDHDHTGNRPQKILGIIGISFVSIFAFSWILNFIPAMSMRTWPADSLRYVVLAVALIILMLLRPEGMFGRSELSLDRFFRRKAAA